VSPPWFGRHVYADTRAIARKTADSMWADHRCHRVQRYHGGLTPPAPGRGCERYGNHAYSSCKFDRNIAAYGNGPSTHAYSICGFDTFTTGGLRPPLLVAYADAVANVRFWPTGKTLFHGGLTPPAPGCTTFAAKNDIRDEQTHVVKSCGHEPGVVFRTASASAMR
jgi:hypothetical protein